MMRRAFVLVAVLVAFSVAYPSDLPRVEIQRHDEGTISQVRLPGNLVGRAMPRDREGKRDLLLLVGSTKKTEEIDPEQPEVVRDEDIPSEEPASDRKLYRVDWSREAPIELLDVDIVARASDLTELDLDGDGIDEILIAGPGGVYLLARQEDGSFAIGLEPLVPGPESGAPGTASLSVAKSAGRLCLAGAGALRCYGYLEDGRGYGLTNEIRLPVNATLRRTSLSVRSPSVQVANPNGDGPPIFFTGPEAFGVKRLRTFRIELEDSPENNEVERWCSFPETEEMLDHAFRSFDGQPALVVGTRRADKLAFFGEKFIRVYFPEPDRTRRGRPPAFAVQSRMNLWQPAQFMSLDVTADGRDDLVVGYWKGLKDDRVVLDVYARTPEGGFSPKVRSTGFDVEKGDRSFIGYGHDLTGDGLYELVVVSDSRIFVHRGQPSRAGDNVVEREPFFAPEVERANRGEVKIYVGTPGSGEFSIRILHRPRFSDLDGDGTDEVIFVGGKKHGDFIVTILDL